MPERRRGVAILAGAGLVAVVAVYLLVGSGAGSQAEAGAAPPPILAASASAAGAGASGASTDGADDEVASWYAGTAQVRGQIVGAVSVVRADIQASNGLALRPDCGRLGEAVALIAPLDQPPAGSAGQAWNAGATAYGAAVTACGNLFDGTPLPPSVLLQRATEALNTADGHWARLAAQLGAPAAVIPAR